MKKQRNKNANTTPTYEQLPPPRSEAYKNFEVINEQQVQIGTNKYLMRNLSGGQVELVRYDNNANRWVVLCFGGIEKITSKQAI
jgi:hypothetical protein